MKKIYAFLMSAVALVGFAACSEGLNEITVNGNDNTTEVTLFAEFEDDTRMTLNGNTPEWEKGDVIYINGVEFTAQEAGSAVQFKGTVSEDMIGQAYTAYFGTMDGKVAAEQTAVAGHMSKETPATAEIAAFESGMTISFKNAAALLQFTPSFSGDVLFEIINGETITLKGCEAGNTYYAAVTPATWDGGVQVSSDNLLCKSGAKGQLIERNKIYPLGNLDRKTATTALWGVCGVHNEWGDAGEDVLMYEDGNYYVSVGVKLGGEFKIRKDNSWGSNYGCDATAAVGSYGEYSIGSDYGGNFQVADTNLRYTIKMSKDFKQLIVCATGYAQESEYSIIGANGNWNYDNYFMNTSVSNVIVAKKVKITTDVGVKIRYEGGWGTSWSCDWKALKVNTKLLCRKGYDCNMLFADGSSDWNKEYDIYVQLASGVPSEFIIVPTGNAAPTF